MLAKGGEVARTKAASHYPPHTHTHTHTDTNTHTQSRVCSSHEGGLALLDVLALAAGARLAAEVDGDAHEQTAAVQEVAGDIHGNQQQHEHHDQDAHYHTRVQVRTLAQGVCSR